MASMAKVLGLIFANMHEQTLPELTKARAMASVPFGSKYRLVDFPLSGMVNSGITQVGIITKQNYYSLMNHLGMGSEWDLARKTGGLHILPPYGREGTGIYRGRLEALAGAAEFIRESNAEYVVMADSNVIANMDMRPIVDFHEKSGADITCVYGSVVYPVERATAQTILCVNEENVVYDVLSRPAMSGEMNVALNIYVMRRAFLDGLIRESECRSLYSFETDILQHKLHDYKVMGYKYDKYFEIIDSMKTYYKATMDMKNRDISREVFSLATPIYTKVRDVAPAKYGIDCSVKSSLVADGCIIDGIVENSVLFRGVKVGKGAVIKDSIVMQGAVIEEKASFINAIADKDVTITKNRTITGSADFPVYISKGGVV
ncbi:MAG: glucose-1-phosphate adenylyltransferase subunit GlgD [Lachnospiraceae bacterium]|nr:glucose-1-phosphate adenylyltransferase subunit GlgD [Ruminococcus sp.]MCM1274413.1 glucose-1-phosphate adenylyltransferase subunit GlgD [Lachnospiraceae bacterium]